MKAIEEEGQDRREYEGQEKKQDGQDRLQRQDIYLTAEGDPVHPVISCLDFAWPLLKTLCEQQVLPYIDYFFTVELLQNVEKVPEAAAFFLCHLSMASRMGHLCVRIQEDAIHPDPAAIWEATAEFPLEADRLRMIESMIREGAVCLPETLVTDVELDFADPATPLCKNKDCYYLQKYWLYETLFIQFYTSLLHRTPEPVFNEQAIQRAVDQLLQEKKLLPEQAAAIAGAFRSTLTVICGGPGTGKTYTAAYIIKTLWQQLSADERERFEILLAAPTGKAAAQLQKSLNRVIDSLEGIRPLAAQTLHTVLGLSKYKKSSARERLHLSADLVLVDECSMIDVKLMTTLLSSIKPGARLILLGDPFQLPPVEAGAVFRDMIDVLNLQAPPAFLKTCLRSELKGILALADAVKLGDAPQVFDLLENRDRSLGVYFHEDVDGGNKKGLEWIVDTVRPYYECSEVNKMTPEAFIVFYNRFRLLTPLRRGLFGVDHLNNHLHKNLLQKFPSRKVFLTPIMIVANHKGLGLFNGETGVLVTQSSIIQACRFQKGDYAVFVDESGIAYKTVPAALLPRFELAYCLSVHKSQGSEFDRVLLVLPEGSEIFGREALYTAITRAKRELHIFSNKKTLEKMIQRCSAKVSGILKRL